MRAVLVFVLLTLGCGAAPVAVNYAPSSQIEGSGPLGAGAFRYLPALAGGQAAAPKVKPNQIRNTAMGSILITENVDSYVRNAIRTELKFIGFRVAHADVQVGGDIEEFLADDLGFSVDWKLRITYRLEQGGAALISRPVQIEKHTAKIPEIVPVINLLIRESLERFLQDAEVRRVFLQHAATAHGARPQGTTASPPLTATPTGEAPGQSVEPSGADEGAASDAQTK